jgi:archaellum component FlaC
MDEITKKEFLEVLNEFSKKTLDPKFEKIDSQFEKTDSQFAEVNSQFKKIDNQFAEVNSRFGKIDDQFAEVNSQFEKIDGQFAGVNSRFEKIDGRFEKIESQFVEFKEDIIHQFHVISEDVISKVQLVAGGVANLNEKLDRHIEENEREHKDILAAIKFSYAELDRRITNLESEMEILKRRMDMLEQRSAS